MPLPVGAGSKPVALLRLEGATRTNASDAVAVEEPLEMRLGDVALAVTMRTPGDDEDLVRGFFLTEGIVLSPEEIAAIAPVGRDGEARLSVELRDGLVVDASRFERRLFVSSSCGICGKGAIEGVRVIVRPPAPFSLRRGAIVAMVRQLREMQPTFDATGGLHAAGLFDLGGQALAVREDVGRHNAVDKVIGAVAQGAWPLPQCVLVVSGRQSFEIVQKAAMAGVGGVIGVSAPSSLAVELARELGMLLVGFARGDRFNVYAGAERVED